MNTREHLSEIFCFLRSVNYECRDVETGVLLSEPTIDELLSELRYLDVLLSPSLAIGVTN